MGAWAKDKGTIISGFLGWWLELSCRLRQVGAMALVTRVGEQTCLSGNFQLKVLAHNEGT